MPLYSFECEFCDNVIEEYRPIKDGPRKNVICEVCGEPMHLQLSCNFILKGSDWPSKEFRKDNTMGELADKAGQFVEEYDGKKKEAKEVLEHRRKGKRHFKEWKRHNYPSAKRYKENIKDGIVGRSVK